ncbi:MAG: sulfurtransferase [Melioribacteraceae bacterium]|nr:sulfurtransferase [Melioribacteraceae bacterium]MCF8356851.1 sulfurtransferase [Melioribacteraceae bacterium]MCF8396230.1 sulfurtransferase [Melioribacteraceae bacterium]MCF8421153.1 sulfurtransferase [Melioribacteraceae bacterium]
MSDINERGYTNPEVLVSTEWVASHLNDEKVRIIESNEDPLLYPSKHIPGAIQIDWTTDLNHPVVRDYLGKEAFQKLLSKNGIDNETTVIFYGDKNNWWACYSLWVFRLFGHTNSKIMDGGRLKWEKENREMTKEVPSYPAVEYNAGNRDDHTYRAFREDVLHHVQRGMPLIDVRSHEEFTGERLHMPDYPNEGALRGGHIPGAASIPWAKAVNPEDGTFKPADELRKLYEGENNLNPDDEIIVYCRIGERSSHTWFVLHYLLGFNNVKNYDGSWTEWGNSVGVPIQK